MLTLTRVCNHWIRVELHRICESRAKYTNHMFGIAPKLTLISTRHRISSLLIPCFHSILEEWLETKTITPQPSMCMITISPWGIIAKQVRRIHFSNIESIIHLFRAGAAVRFGWMFSDDNVTWTWNYPITSDIRRMTFGKSCWWIRGH